MMLAPTKLAAGLLTAALLLPASAALAGPFTALAGSWGGGGELTFSDGHSERLRCRASYQPDRQGDNLQLSLRCASPSYNFELASDVAYRGGAISGTWSEASHNVSGAITGTADANRIEAAARGTNFAANLLLVTRGNRQSVSIRSAGSQISDVSLALSRR